jgi:hypothetical protein
MDKLSLVTEQYLPPGTKTYYTSEWVKDKTKKVPFIVISIEDAKKAKYYPKLPLSLKPVFGLVEGSKNPGWMPLNRLTVTESVIGQDILWD